MYVNLQSLLLLFFQQIEQDHDSIANDNPGVIILHPGSSTLRLGLSTQPSPNAIPHLIAYRTMGAWSSEEATPSPTTGGTSLLLRYETELTVSVPS